MNCLVTKGSIHYKVFGTGHPILILHSMGTDFRSMSSWIEPIFENVPGFQRIYIDLPAHGESDINESFNSSDDMLLNILDFIDKTITNQMFSLIGFSYGGYLAQGILHSKKSSIRSICLLATSLHLKERKLPQKIVINKNEALLSGLEHDIKIAIETLMNYQDEEHIKCFLSEIQPGRVLANKNFLLSNWRENGYSLSEEPFHNVKEISQTALIILGKQDAICGYEDHFFLLKKFSKATFAILDHAGHMLQIEKRELVQSLMKDWLTRTIQST
ncbi:alpha/beta fold hydrolase [Psychrobacillus vulpis]|uniref:Alpha/beta hydrolase n=1 Tax=Psychrobacillus vulpis TaxID=2325572 RepID=A0A544TLU1_9BACI|nr:alpha/beta hydrolase [Psychrobacillus vulpis]TQR18422.1 alpha/beta hydrolase [Psychrobacillus vulpis]